MPPLVLVHLIARLSHLSFLFTFWRALQHLSQARIPCLVVSCSLSRNSIPANFQFRAIMWRTLMNMCGGASWVSPVSAVLSARHLYCVSQQMRDKLTVCKPEPGLQAFTGAALAQLVANKAVDTAAIAAVMSTLGVQDPASTPQPNYAWIAGPVLGGVAGAAILVGVIWLLHKRNMEIEAGRQFSAAGADGAVRVRRAEDKYAAPDPVQQHHGSDGGTPHSAAQVGFCNRA